MLSPFDPGLPASVSPRSGILLIGLLFPVSAGLRSRREGSEPWATLSFVFLPGESVWEVGLH